MKALVIHIYTRNLLSFLNSQDCQRSNYIMPVVFLQTQNLDMDVYDG